MRGGVLARSAFTVLHCIGLEGRKGHGGATDRRQLGQIISQFSDRPKTVSSTGHREREKEKSNGERQVRV